MSDYYRGLSSFQGALLTEFSNSSGSAPGEEVRFAAQRPNLAFIRPDQTNQTVLVSDGTDVFQYEPEYYRIYYATKAPSSLEGITNGMPGIILHTLFMSNRFEYVMSGFDEGNLSMTELSSLRYLGMNTVEGIVCDRLRMELRHKTGTPADGPVNSTNDLWIAAGRAPAVVKFEFRICGPGINFKTGTEISNDVAVLAETVKDWKANEPISPVLFKFAPPTNSTRVNPDDKVIKVKDAEGNKVTITRDTGTVEVEVSGTILPPSSKGK